MHQTLAMDLSRALPQGIVWYLGRQSVVGTHSIPYLSQQIVKEVFKRRDLGLIRGEVELAFL